MSSSRCFQPAAPRYLVQEGTGAATGAWPYIYSKGQDNLTRQEVRTSGFLDPTSLSADGSNRPPSPSRPGSSSSRKRRRVTSDDNVSAQEEFVSEAPVVPACPLRRRKNARTRLSVQFKQVQDSVQQESTSGPSQQENDFVTVAKVKELTQRYQLMALADETRRNYL